MSAFGFLLCVSLYLQSISWVWVWICVLFKAAKAGLRLMTFATLWASSSPLCGWKSPASVHFQRFRTLYNRAPGCHAGTVAAPKASCSHVVALSIAQFPPLIELWVRLSERVVPGSNLWDVVRMKTGRAGALQSHFCASYQQAQLGNEVVYSLQALLRAPTLIFEQRYFSPHVLECLYQWALILPWVPTESDYLICRLCYPLCILCFTMS